MVNLKSQFSPLSTPLCWVAGRANALAIVPEDIAAVEAGQEVECLLLS